MRLKILFSSIVITLILSGCVSEETIVKNGDFSDELDHWEILPTSESDLRGISVVKTDGLHANVLDNYRSNSGADGASVRILQELDFDVSGYSAIYLKADVKVISYNLEGSGWWSDTYGGAGEYPAHLYVLLH